MKNNFGIEFFGADTVLVDSHGVERPHTFLDTAASSLCMVKPYRYREQMLSLYGNIHSGITHPSRYCTDEFETAKSTILSFLGLSADDYLCIFTGSGSTSAINMFAKLLSSSAGDTVVISEMEHHSNDLPHRLHCRSVVHIPPEVDSSGELGGIDAERFDLALQKGSIKYAAITGCSNVTGIVNPVHDIARHCQMRGVPILLDASQSLAHCLGDMYRNEANGLFDAIVFSGHKAYAPGTPGVLVIKRSLYEQLPATELGGGVVSDVSKYSYEMNNDPHETTQAGTPDFLGAVQISRVLQELERVGVEKVQEHESDLSLYLVSRLRGIGDAITIYGSADRRSGIVSFNVRGYNHEQVATMLSREYCISLRNACFCAHPYVRSLLRFDNIKSGVISDDSFDNPGMVRASLGIYSSEEDVDQLECALREIVNRGLQFKKYTVRDRDLLEPSPAGPGKSSEPEEANVL